MKPIIHSSKREDLLNARDGYFCASEIAQLLNEGYAKTETERAAQRGVCITAKALRERFEPDEELGETMEIASWMEPLVLERARLKWWPEADFRLDGWLRQDQACARHAATPDAIVWNGEQALEVVDCKVSATQAQEDCKPGSAAAFASGAPLYLALQLQSQMAVTGAQVGWNVVLHRGGRSLKLRRYRVDRHPAAIARIYREVTSAWSEVESIREGRNVA
jgi:hypothetical protein